MTKTAVYGSTRSPIPIVIVAQPDGAETTNSLGYDKAQREISIATRPVRRGPIELVVPITGVISRKGHIYNITGSK